MLHCNINKRKRALAAMRSMHAAILTFYYQIVAGAYSNRRFTVATHCSSFSWVISWLS
jgi:hypothetical protein